ncbi:MAG: ABC transporter permease [Propionibacterium sp.]|nr:MAG: ABC transporter permease [Propionibacterium sp.]
MNRWVRISLGLIGVGLLLVVWALAASQQPEYVFPGPIPTWYAWLELYQGGHLITPLLTTLIRALIGLGLAISVGVLWGALSAFSTVFDVIFRSWLILLLAIPPIVIVVIAMLGFGPSPPVVLTVVFLVTLPLIANTTRDAIAGVDIDLLEMARALNRKPWWRWRHVITPSVLPPLLTAIAVATGHSLRITVMAELLSTATGIGAEVQLARNNLATAEVFALALTLALMTAILDLLLLRPLRKKFGGFSAISNKGMNNV